MKSEQTPLRMTLRWIDLPYEVCQQILLYALDLETSPLAQPYQQHDHVFRGRMTLRIHPGTSKYFDCPTASPSPLRRMVHITHRFNKDLDAALPSMERQLEGILGELRLGTEAALKAWFRNYREDYEIVEERSQHGEVGWILQTMAGQVKHNITAIQQLHLSVRMLQAMRTLSLNLMPRRQALLTLLEDDCEPAEWATKAGPLVEAPNETCFLERADRRLDGGATESTERSYHEEDGSMQLARIPGVTYGFSVPEIRGGELACLVKQLRFS